MRILLTTMGGCGTNEEMSDEIVWIGGDVTRDGNNECEDEEGEFDHYEPQSPATPASSSTCPASPTTPPSSRSSTLSDCYLQRSLFPSAASITKSMNDPVTASMQLQTLFSTTTTGSPIAPTGTQKPKLSISDLPPELLQQVFRYALDENWSYDYLEDGDGNSATGGDSRGVVIPGENGAHFRIMRIEIQLSQVCRWWREVMRNHLVRKTLIPSPSR